MQKIIIKHNDIPIAEVSVDASVFGNMSVPQAVRLMAEGHVSLEVQDKQIFMNTVNFACVVMQLLQSEKIRCVPPSTSATPG